MQQNNNNTGIFGNSNNSKSTCGGQNIINPSNKLKSKVFPGSGRNITCDAPDTVALLYYLLKDIRDGAVKIDNTLADGRLKKIIAGHLNLTPRTVQNYLREACDNNRLATIAERAIESNSSLEDEFNLIQLQPFEDIAYQAVLKSLVINSNPKRNKNTVRIAKRQKKHRAARKDSNSEFPESDDINDSDDDCDGNDHIQTSLLSPIKPIINTNSMDCLMSVEKVSSPEIMLSTATLPLITPVTSTKLSSSSFDNAFVASSTLVSATSEHSDCCNDNKINRRSVESSESIDTSSTTDTAPSAIFQMRNVLDSTEMDTSINSGISCTDMINENSDYDNLYSNELNERTLVDGRIKRRNITVTIVEEFDRCLLRRKINYLQRDKNLKVTMTILRELAYDEINFIGSRPSCLKIVHDLGFQFRKCGKRHVLIEDETMRLERLQYIKSIKTYRLERRPIVFITKYFLDYRNRMLDALTMNEATLVSEKTHIICGLECFGYEADHLNSPIIIIELEDFHYEIYEKEIENKLLPILPANSVIVIDNLSPFHRILAHSAPKPTASIDKMMQWLNERNLQYNVTSHKQDIYEQILEHKKTLPKEYKIDKIIQKYNHTILRSPDAHPELNPVQCFWACVTTQQFKNKLNVEESRELSMYRYTNVDTKEWAFVCENVIVSEDFLVEQEDVYSELMEQINYENEKLFIEQQEMRAKVQFTKAELTDQEQLPSHQQQQQYHELHQIDKQLVQKNNQPHQVFRQHVLNDHEQQQHNKLQDQIDLQLQKEIDQQLQHEIDEHLRLQIDQHQQHGEQPNPQFLELQTKPFLELQPKQFLELQPKQFLELQPKQFLELQPKQHEQK